MNEVVVLGIGQTVFGKFPDKTAHELGQEAVGAALRDSGVDPRAIEVAYAARAVNATTDCQKIMMAHGITEIEMFNVQNACAGGSTAVRGVWKDIASGLYDVGIAVGVEAITGTTVASRPLKASQGGGKGCALQFASEGADVALIGRNMATLSLVAKAAQSRGVRALPLVCDVNHVPQIRECVEQVARELGSIDILVNAAQAPEMRSGPLLDVDPEIMQLMWSTGPVATLEFMRACHPFLKRAGGCVINFCTGAMFKPQNNGAYAGVKSAIQMITRAAAIEWVDDGIRANVVVPLINSPVFEAYRESDPQFAEQFVSAIPLKRMGDPEWDIGRALVFLAGSDSQYITGSTLMLDGGHQFLR